MTFPINEAKLTYPVLNQLAEGTVNNQLVGDFLLPFVPMNTEIAKVPQFGKDIFVIENDDIRELMAESNKIPQVQYTSKTIETVERDLAHPIDYRQNKEADLPYEQYAVKVVKEKMELNREKRISTLVQSDIYGANEIILSGTDQFTSPSSDIFKSFDDAMEAVRSSSGRAPNEIVIAQDAWVAIKNHPQVIDVLKRRGVQRLTPSLFVDMLGDDVGDNGGLRVHVGRAHYQTALDSAPIKLWSNVIILAYVPRSSPGAGDMFQPTFGYTPRRTGGFFADKYDEVGGKVYNVRITDNCKEYVMMPEAGYIMRNVVTTA